MAVGVSDRRGTAACAAAGTPGVVARAAVDAERKALVVAGAAIDVTVLLDHPAVVVLHLAGREEIDLLRVEAVPRAIELEQGRAGAVAAGAEHEVAAGQGRRDVRGAVGDAVVRPEERALGRINANHAAADERHVLLHAAGVGNHDRGVTRAVLAPSAKAPG